MEEPKKKKPYGMTWRGILVAVASYFVIKYGIAAQFFELSELRLLYSLGLIIACSYFGKVVDEAIKERKKR